MKGLFNPEVLISCVNFFCRYLKTTETAVNGDDLQEDETSGATSGEEIWGTPTSGGEMEDPLSSPNYEGKQSVSKNYRKKCIFLFSLTTVQYRLTMETTQN